MDYSKYISILFLHLLSKGWCKVGPADPGFDKITEENDESWWL